MPFFPIFSLATTAEGPKIFETIRFWAGVLLTRGFLGRISPSVFCFSSSGLTGKPINEANSGFFFKAFKTLSTVALTMRLFFFFSFCFCQYLISCSTRCKTPRITLLNSWYPGLSFMKPVRSEVMGRKSAWISPVKRFSCGKLISMPNRSLLIVTPLTLISIPGPPTIKLVLETKMSSPLIMPYSEPSKTGMRCPARKRALIFLLLR